MRDIEEKIPSSIWDKTLSVWKAGLLTGLATHGLNFTANAFHLLTEQTTDYIGALADMGFKKFTGKRALVATSKGTVKGFKKGAKSGWDYIKTGYDERNIGAKYDYKEVHFDSKFGKFLGTYTKGVFRFLGGADQPFYYSAANRSLYNQAMAQAGNKGLKGSKAKKFIDDLVKSPTDEMMETSVKDAETAVFLNRTKAGEAAKKIQDIKPFEYLVPFSRTPSAVITQVFNYTPVGIIKEIGGQIMKGKFDQRALSKAIGRGVEGTAFMYLGRELYKSGFISLGYSPSTRATKEVKGESDNAIKIGDRWMNAEAFGPAGLALLLGGYYQKGLDETGSITKAVSQSVVGGVQVVKDLPFVSGISEIADILTTPIDTKTWGKSITERVSRFGKSMLGSVVPTGISDIAQVTDKYEREAEGIAGYIKAKTPGLRQTLKPRLDIFGEKVKRKEGTDTLGAVAEMIDPFRSTKALPADDATKEMERLVKAKEDVRTSKFYKKTTINGKNVVLNQEQVNKVRDFIGKNSRGILNDLVKSEFYQSLLDEEKATQINYIRDQLKKTAKVKLLGDVNPSAKAVEEIFNNIRGRMINSSIQKLREEGEYAEANKKINNLSKDEFEAYKDAKSYITRKKKDEEIKQPTSKERAEEIYQELKDLPADTAEYQAKMMIRDDEAVGNA
ncbi:MAG: hypothetical protein U9O91_05055, partial [Candidatus Caldatribacteriota bacterium]|nr:hypothetical protein [Candidatus Caldatribacteriota bacterium]